MAANGALHPTAKAAMRTMPQRVFPMRTLAAEHDEDSGIARERTGRHAGRRGKAPPARRRFFSTRPVVEASCSFPWRMPQRKAVSAFRGHEHRYDSGEQLPVPSKKHLRRLGRPTRRQSPRITRASVAPRRKPESRHDRRTPVMGLPGSRIGTSTPIAGSVQQALATR